MPNGVNLVTEEKVCEYLLALNDNENILTEAAGILSVACVNNKNKN